MKRSPLKRKTAIKRQSKKGAAFEREFKAMKKKMLPSKCMATPIFAAYPFPIKDSSTAASYASICYKSAVTLHHILRRARGGKNNQENLLPVCRSCHNWIHNNISLSIKLGILK